MIHKELELEEQQHQGDMAVEDAWRCIIINKTRRNPVLYAGKEMYGAE